MRNNKNKTRSIVLLTLTLTLTLALTLTGCSSNTDKPVETTPIDPIETEDVSKITEPTEKESVETEETLKLTDEEIEKLEKNAISLSKSIIIYNHSFTNVLYNRLQSVSPEEITVEFLYIYIDEDNPYYDSFQFNYDNDGTLIQAIYSLSALDTFYQEVFPNRRYATDVDAGETTIIRKDYYDEEKQEINIEDYELWNEQIEVKEMYYPYSNLLVIYDNDKIITSFDMKQEVGDLMNFSIIYKILKNDEGELYLQYAGTEKTGQ